MRGDGVGVDLEVSLRWGVSRIAKVAQGRSNHEYVYGFETWGEGLGSAVDPATGLIPSECALSYLAKAWSGARYRRYYGIREGDVAAILGYAYTVNNQKEFEFLETWCQQSSIDRRVVNLCTLPYHVSVGVDQWIVNLLCEAIGECGDGRGLQVGLVHELVKFGTSIQSALSSLESSGGPGWFAVANDHSPAPVGFASVARHLGRRLVYLQHAEISTIFPELDFDLSVLRNRNSVATYARIGSVDQSTVVLSREVVSGWIEPEWLGDCQESVLAAPQCSVVIYPSSVFEMDYLRAVVDLLASNNWVGEVYVKPHPNGKMEISVGAIGGAEVVHEPVAVPHLAICGNSSVVVELLGRGSVVFQDFGLF